jgi:predicted phage tail protein
MLREIRVYGKLAEFLGQRVFHAAVNSVAEAVRFLCVNFQGLEEHMSDHHYRVSAGRFTLGLEEVHHPTGGSIIRIAPVVAGGGGAVGRIAAGVALIAASFFTGGATIGLGVGTIAVSTVAFGIGASLALGGIAQLLTPTPKNPTGPDSESDPRKSYSFSGVQNTARQGVPIPVIYGEVITGSVVISAGVDITQIQK